MKNISCCGELTLAGCQMLTQLLTHSSSTGQAGKMREKLAGQNKDREITS